MNKIIEWFNGLSSRAKILFAVVLIGGLGYAFFASTFKTKKPDVVEESSIHISMPDAEQRTSSQSRMKEYSNADYESSRKSATDYWNDLAAQGSDGLGDGGLVINGGNGSGLLAGGSSARYNGEYLDPDIYSEIEIYYIKNNIKSKAEIDAEHEQKRLDDEAMNRRFDESRSSAVPQMTQEQKDSIYFARMEKAYEMAAKYSQGAQASSAADPEPEPEPDPEPEPRKIDLTDKKQNVEASFISVDGFESDGIISSLETPSSAEAARNGHFHASPVKATFLSTEKLKSGQRVIIRLMQDLVLSSGTMIPANTHLTATVDFRRRLQLRITSIHYGSKMFRTDIVAYDNDGTEGIYCPYIETEKGNKSKKRVAGAVAGGTASAFLSAVSGNPYVARALQSATQEVTSSISDEGATEVNVVAGYVFYLQENIDKVKIAKND